MRDYWQRHRDSASSFLLEEQVEGQDLRLQVIGGRLAASCIRIPAHVVGDGRTTLGRLVEERQRVVHEQNPADSLDLDRASFALIEDQGLTLDSVPEAGRRVWLKTVTNIGQGGVAVDIGDQVHSGYRDWVRRIVDFCGATFFALDVMCQDPAQDPAESGAVAIELNAMAEWTHHAYSEGGTRELGSVVIDAAFAKKLELVAS